MSAAHELKDKLLQVLLAHSYSLLANSGSPPAPSLAPLLGNGGVGGQGAGIDQVSTLFLPFLDTYSPIFSFLFAFNAIVSL